MKNGGLRTFIYTYIGVNGLYGKVALFNMASLVYNETKGNNYYRTIKKKKRKKNVHSIIEIQLKILEMSDSIWKYEQIGF